MNNSLQNINKPIDLRSKSAWSRRSGVLKLAIILFFTVIVVIPLCKMLFTITTVDAGKIISSQRFSNALINSLKASSLSTIITVIFAFFLARAIARSTIKFKNIFITFFILPMLIPSISHGMGLIVLFGRNGIITNLIGGDANIYGLTGIVTGSVMYSFPVAFIMIYDILRYEDDSPYEAASVLGIPKIRQFTSITFPYLRKPLIVVVFAVFTMIVTDYGVPLIIGGRFTTLPVVMYQDVIGQTDFGKGSVIGLVLLVPALIAFLVDMINKDKGNSAFVLKSLELRKNKTRNIVSYFFCGTVSLLVLLPIFSFSVLTIVKKYPVNMTATLDNIARAFDMKAGTFLINSITIAIVVAFTGAAIAFICAYLTARMKSGMSRMLHLISITSLAIPGLVLGLSYAMFFSGSFIYSTMTILIMANFIHFFASPYLMMYNTLGKINENVEDVGATLGISRRRIITGVILPQSKATIIEMMSYFFVNSMMTISAVSFLFNPSNKPISLMITNFEANRLLECAAFVSLLILFVNIIFKTLANTVKKIMKVDI